MRSHGSVSLFSSSPSPRMPPQLWEQIGCRCCLCTRCLYRRVLARLYDNIRRPPSSCLSYYAFIDPSNCLPVPMSSLTHAHTCIGPLNPNGLNATTKMDVRDWCFSVYLALHLVFEGLGHPDAFALCPWQHRHLLTSSLQSSLSCYIKQTFQI